MALSNLTREPQREITESLVGILTLSLVAVAWWWVADLFAGWTWGATPAWVVMWMFLIVAGLFLAFLGVLGLLAFTHRLGEEVCDLMNDAGIDPRPRLRRQVVINSQGEWITVWR